jgi:hypothetical protein
MAAADRILKVDHVAIALPSIAESVPLFRDALGGRENVGFERDDVAFLDSLDYGLAD